MLNILWYFIYSALALSAITSFILAYQKKEFRYWYAFSFVCVFIIFHEYYLGNLYKQNKPTEKFYNLAELIHFVTFYFLQSNFSKVRINKIVFNTLIVFQIAYSLLTWYVWGSINQYNTKHYSVICIFLLLSCLFSLGQILMKLSNEPLQKQPQFIFCIAIIYFYGTSFILFSAYNLLYTLPKEFLNGTAILFYINYTLCYSFCAWGFCSQINFKKLKPNGLN